MEQRGKKKKDVVKYKMKRRNTLKKKRRSGIERELERLRDLEGIGIGREWMSDHGRFKDLGDRIWIISISLSGTCRLKRDRQKATNGTQCPTFTIDD